MEGLERAGHDMLGAYVVRAKWGEQALRETIEAMLRGELAIHGAALWLLGEDVYTCLACPSCRLLFVRIIFVDQR